MFQYSKPVIILKQLFEPTDKYISSAAMCLCLTQILYIKRDQNEDSTFKLLIQNTKCEVLHLVLFAFLKI